MEDWKGLLNWSTNYHDGTENSNVTPMSEEDRKWLEAAMKEYTFSDTDKLKELCDLMKKDIDEGFKHQGMVDVLDQVSELVEIHERNNYNLAMMGGLHSTLEIILKHPQGDVRKMACTLFSGVVQNNLEVQEFANKLGALSLMPKFVQEEDIKNREAVIGALSSFIRSENFVGKREFISKMGGLQFLSATLHEKNNQSDRLLKKVLILMYDLLLNDDTIFEENPKMVRETFGKQMSVTDKMIELLMDSSQNITKAGTWDLREYILLCLFRILQVCPELIEKYAAALNQHKINLGKEL